MAHARPIRLQIRYLSSGSLLCVFPRDRWGNGEARAIGTFLGTDEWQWKWLVVVLCSDERFKHCNAPSKVCLQHEFYWQILLHVNLVEVDKITAGKKSLVLRNCARSCAPPKSLTPHLQVSNGIRQRAREGKGICVDGCICIPIPFNLRWMDSSQILFCSYCISW